MTDDSLIPMDTLRSVCDGEAIEWRALALTAESRAERLAAALGVLATFARREDGEPCWCLRARKRHTRKCLEVRAVLAAHEAKVAQG